MKSGKKKISEEFIQELRTATFGYLPEADFEILLKNIEKEISAGYFSPGVESNLRRIISSLFDRASFLIDSLKYPHYLQILFAIAVNSNYLTDIIIRNPEYLYWIVSPDNLNSRLSYSYLKKTIRDSLIKFRSFNARVNFLRSLKRREMLRTGVNDILRNSPLKETTEQLSVLAKVINEELFALCFDEISERYGVKIKAAKYCLVALGKLGGDELNYSSDVDFMLIFDKNRQSGKTEYFQILTDAAHLFIQTSTAMTDKGYIYRVDFRLRPDGRNSPLCRTLKDYLRYYESRGEDWERQMLIKMSFAGGSRKLYESFSGYITNFIYPHSFSRSPLEQIAIMKSNIEKHTGDRENVKTFSGGIRDIEFAVQALQLLNGGKNENIRSGNTTDSIHLLQNNGLLSSDEAALFLSAYEFYRRTEHYLQLMNDTQTHIIPQSGEILEKLSIFMGFKNTASFLSKVDLTRKAVRKVFISITGQKDDEAPASSLETISFTDRKKALNNYRYLQGGYGLLEQKLFDSQTINAFQAIEEDLFEFLSGSFAPDTVLDNFARIIRNRPLPSIWYNEFRDRFLFTSFLTMCERCQKAVDMSVTDKSLGDLLLSRKIFEKITGEEVNLPVTHMVFILAVQFSLGFLDHARVSGILSCFLRQKITGICARHIKDYDFCVLSMGSFAAGEMTFASDLDLVFVAEDVQKYPDIEKDFQKLLSEIQEGVRPFETDFRLRPEGKSAQIVWDIKSYNEYIEKRIQTWELQSLTKLRLVCGSSRLFETFKEKLLDKIRKSDAEKIKTDIIEMRKKTEKQLAAMPQSHFGNFFSLKKSRGGITDIEFAVQYIKLTNPEIFEKTTGESLYAALKFLIDFSDNFFSFETLKENCSLFKSLEFHNQILFNINTSILPLDNAKRYILARAAGFRDLREFESALPGRARANREITERVFRGKTK
ncbi:MAG: hypothetical protein ACM3Q2_08710 [Syntrophothermus sp.]